MRPAIITAVLCLLGGAAQELDAFVERREYVPPIGGGKGAE